MRVSYLRRWATFKQGTGLERSLAVRNVLNVTQALKIPTVNLTKSERLSIYGFQKKNYKAGCQWFCGCCHWQRLLRLSGWETTRRLHLLQTPHPSFLNKCVKQSVKCKMNKNYLHVDQPKAGRFYIPKADNPGGPVVSANNHPMEKITELWICICNFR